MGQMYLCVVLKSRTGSGMRLGLEVGQVGEKDLEVDNGW